MWREIWKTIKKYCITRLTSDTPWLAMIGFLAEFFGHFNSSTVILMFWAVVFFTPEYKVREMTADLRQRLTAWENKKAGGFRQ